MFGKNLKEEAEIDMLIQTAEDIMLAFAQKAYDPNFVSDKVLNIYPLVRLADIVQKKDKILDRILPYEARAELCLLIFCSFFGKGVKILCILSWL